MSNTENSHQRVNDTCSDDRPSHRAETQPRSDICFGQRDLEDVHHGGGFTPDSRAEDLRTLEGVPLAQSQVLLVLRKDSGL